MKIGQIIEQRGINIRGNIIIAKERDITSIMKAKVHRTTNNRQTAPTRVVQTTSVAATTPAVAATTSAVAKPLVKGEALLKRYPDLSMDEYMWLTTDEEIKKLFRRFK